MASVPKGRGSRQRAPVVTFGDVPTSIVWIAPLFLCYQIGVIFSSRLNGADFLTRLVFEGVGHQRDRYLLVHGVLSLILIGYVIYLRRRRGFSLSAFTPILLESTIIAMTMGTFIVFVLEQLFGSGFLVAAMGQVGNAVVTSLGAGVYEEVVFRLGLMGGMCVLLDRCGIGRVVGTVVAAVVSSVLFALAHHVGAHGEAFSWGAFAYRALAGAAFAAIFYFRSLAHAVYTHVLYDLYVLVIR